MAIPTPTDKPCPREPEEYSTPGTLWSICPGNFVPSAKKESSHFLGKNPFSESAEYIIAATCPLLNINLSLLIDLGSLLFILIISEKRTSTMSMHERHPPRCDVLES